MKSLLCVPAFPIRTQEATNASRARIMGLHQRIQIDSREFAVLYHCLPIDYGQVHEAHARAAQQQSRRLQNKSNAI
jgi:hypothetical protein